MSENFQIGQKINIEKIKLQIDSNTPSNIDLDLNLILNYDINRFKELNNKCAELISEEKVEEAIKILKKIELFLESNIMDQRLNFDKKLLIIILHNIACAHQKLKDLDNCISYLESVLYHYDLSLEKKHNIKINDNYFIQHIRENKDNYQLLGDLILELRYSAKFHLQMSAILSEANRHAEALNEAKLASIICEDNLVKTNYLYYQIRDKQIKNGKSFNNNKNLYTYNGGYISNNNSNNGNGNDDDNILLNDKIKLNFKIISELNNLVLNSKNYKESKNKIYSFSNKCIKSEIISENNKNKNGSNNNHYNSYINYRSSEISKFNRKNSLINKIRYIFGGTIRQDDWIQLLNIENILFLSPLNVEDLDLDSDSRFELLKDTILEKIVMLTVAYYCISKEMRLLSKDKDKSNKKLNGEYYLYQAIEYSSLFFPASCPIIKNYISMYYKNYGQNMEVIPEGKIFDIKVNLLRNELEQNQDTLSFIKLKKFNYINKVQTNSKNNLNDSKNNNLQYKNGNINLNLNLNNILIPRLYISNKILNNNNNYYVNNSNNNTYNNDKMYNNINSMNKLINFTETNNNTNINTNTNTNSSRKINNNNKNINTNNNSSRIKKENKKFFKSCEKNEKNKRKSIPKKGRKKKSMNNNKPLSSNSVNVNKNNSNQNQSEKKMKYIRSFNKNKSKSKSKSNSKNRTSKNESEKNKYKKAMKINLNLNIRNNNFDLLPNKNFLNFAKNSKINEKMAPKFKLNFAKLNKSYNESEDNDNNECTVKYNTNINSLNKINTKSNRNSKKNTEMMNTCNGNMKKNKMSKKNFNINLNSNNTKINGRELKTERLQNPKIKIEKKIYNNKKNNKNNKNIKIKTKNININLGDKNVFLSPKNNYASFLMKKKEIRGNKTERILNRNKMKMKNNSNRINDIRVKFNSPPTKSSISKTYRYFKYENYKLKNMQNAKTNNSFVNNNKNKINKLMNSVRYQYVNYTQKQKNSQSYGNNSNNSNSDGNKDNMIKSVEVINKYLFNKNKSNNNFSSENISFQKQPFKNKINLNKHHLNDNLVSHFNNIKY